MKRLTLYLFTCTLTALVTGCATTEPVREVLEPIDFSKRARLEDGPEGARLIFPDGLLFATNVATVTEEASKNVDDCIFIIERARGTIVVEGHTDSTGLRVRNEELSSKRAEAVRAELIKRKVAPSRIEIRALAATKPVVPNASTPSEMAQNRRAEIIFRGETTSSLNAPHGCGGPPSVRRVANAPGGAEVPVSSGRSVLERLTQELDKVKSKIPGN